jgi:hypothetical protein
MHATLMVTTLVSLSGGVSIGNVHTPSMSWCPQVFFFFFLLLFIFYILDFVLFIHGIYVMSILNDRTMCIYIYIKFNLNYKMSVQLV